MSYDAIDGYADLTALFWDAGLIDPQSADRNAEYDQEREVAACAFALGKLIGERERLRSALADLLAWCDHPGFWNAPCWNEARRALGHEVTP
jgi:hypothetical protein